MLYGFRLVRPVNFVAGAYLGGTSSLILLQIFAPAFPNCYAIVAGATVCALVLGMVCYKKRTSVLVVLGIVLGEIVGDNFYKLFLASVFPEYVAFGCIGFFAVLLGVGAASFGDFFVKATTAFFGAYIVVCSILKLVVIPYVPKFGPQFVAFLSYKPALAKALTLSPEVTGPLIASPYVYGPVALVLLLTAIGTQTQLKLLAKEEDGDMERLIRK